MATENTKQHEETNQTRRATEIRSGSFAILVVIPHDVNPTRRGVTHLHHATSERP